MIVKKNKIKTNKTLTNNIQRKQTLSGPNCIFIAYHIVWNEKKSIYEHHIRL